MGKATRWFMAILGIKREKNADQNSYLPAGDKKEKNRWSFSKSGKEFTGKVQRLPLPPPRKAAPDGDWQRSYTTAESEEHAIAVAAASAVAADAAVAAAQAAVAVVRLTNQTRGGGGALFYGGKEVLSALKIQKVFRGFLARKALRALRGLVKLQALIRGFLVRKRAAATLQSMQALIRAQTTLRSHRARRSNSNNKENKSRSETSPDDDDHTSLYSDETQHPKIVEVDTLFKRPKSRSRRFNSSTLFSEIADDRPSPYFWAVASPARFSSGKEWCGGEEFGGRLSTAQSTPRVATTPGRSVYAGEGYFRPYNYPNYMANTKSFKAKLRSRSAPKQRPEIWMKKRVALNEIMGPRNSVGSSLAMHNKSCNRHDHEGFHEF